VVSSFQVFWQVILCIHYTEILLLKNIFYVEIIYSDTLHIIGTHNFLCYMCIRLLLFHSFKGYTVYNCPWYI
jgi:hypothetical protein